MREARKNHAVFSKMKKRGLFRLIAVLAIVLIGGPLILDACAKKSEPAAEENLVEAKKIQIGFSLDSLVIERWQRDRDVFVSKAQELGAEVNVQNANGDLNTQIAQIEYFIQKEVDVIVVVTNDSTGLSDTIKKVKDSGIAVIAYDRLIMDAPIDLYISFDNERVGSLMAESLSDRLGGKGRILMICGPLEDHNVELVMKGFHQVIDGTGIEIVQVDYAPNWLSETGFSVTSNYLGNGGTIDGIMCGNDSIAGQAIKALAERRLAISVPVVGQDADLDACQRVVEGTQLMTVYKPVEKLAGQAAEFAVKLAKQEKIDVSETIENGGRRIPYIRLEPTAVTKENMDEVIIGKYHQESDVYRNLPTKE